MNINPFISLISQGIGIYVFFLMVYLVLDWLIHFSIIDNRNHYVQKVHYTLHKITEPVLRKIRQYIPTKFGNIDIAPVVLILLLNFIKNILYTYLYVK